MELVLLRGKLERHFPRIKPDTAEEGEVERPLPVFLRIEYNVKTIHEKDFCVTYEEIRTTRIVNVNEFLYH